MSPDSNVAFQERVLSIRFQDAFVEGKGARALSSPSLLAHPKVSPQTGEITGRWSGRVEHGSIKTKSPWLHAVEGNLNWILCEDLAGDRGALSLKRARS